MIYFSSPLVFLYINDLPQAIVSNSLLYADDTCILFQHKSVIEIEKQLIRVFFRLCDWFVDNKLIVHFWQDRTKSVLFGSEHIWFIKLQNFPLSPRDKIRAWVQVSGMGLYVKTVFNTSITLLFSQEVPCLNMLQECQPLLSHWHMAVCDEVIVDWVRDMSSQKTHYAAILCHLIYLMWIFDFAYYDLLF